MFHRERWVSAFIRVLGKDADAGLACLKALTPPLKSLRGVLLGSTAAVKAERLLRGAAASLDTAASPDAAALEYAIRFIILLVERNCFRHIDSLMRQIEKRIDAQKGILDIVVESAVPVDSAMEEELRRLVTERTGAGGIKMQVRIVPELLGGFRLRIGGLCVDASLKGQTENMTAELLAAAVSIGVGVSNGANGAVRSGGV